MQLFNKEVQIGEGFEIDGLSVFPITGVGLDAPPYLTGPEALEAGLLSVSELDPPQVPLLAVSNLASVPILLVEGELLVGGDQNRTMNVTILCPPQETTVVPVSCVEAGRWGGAARRTMSASHWHAPGSLRSAKTASLGPRSADRTSRHSDQGTVWDEVERQSVAHGVVSETRALNDIQQETADRFQDRLESLTALPGQIGVVCAIGDQVLGLDLFDSPSTLDKYLRRIIAGNALDLTSEQSESSSLKAVEKFLARVNDSGLETGEGVGLGQEILLRGEIAGVGLTHEDRLVHLAAFPKIVGETL